MVASIQIDPSNAAQAEAWDGGEGAYWAARADRFDEGIAAYHGAFMAAAAIEPSDSVLDLGCGNGRTTLDAARTASGGAALGVDLSGAMIAEARRRADAEGVGNVRFDQVDAQIYPFEAGAFDVAICRTAAMFFGDQVAAFSNTAQALRADGRLVLLTWQGLAENEWIREWSTALTNGRGLTPPPPGAPSPFSLSEPDAVRDVLTRGGFSDVHLEPLNGPMYAGPDADDAYEFVLGLAGWMATSLSDDERAQSHEALRRTIEAHDRGPDTGVVYESGAWLVTARKGR